MSVDSLGHLQTTFKLIEDEIATMAKKNGIRSDFFRAGISPMFSPGYKYLDLRWWNNNKPASPQKEETQNLAEKLIHSIQKSWVQCQWELEIRQDDSKEQHLILHARVLYRKRDEDSNSDLLARWPRVE